jgi:hypothetical protein
MSGRASGGAVKRERVIVCAMPDHADEEEGALTILIVFKTRFDTLVGMQLCSPQGVAKFSDVRLLPRVSHPFAGAQVYSRFGVTMPESMTQAKRLRTVGSGFKGSLVRLLSLRVVHYSEPQRNWRACRSMMQMTVRRVASRQLAAVRDGYAKEGEELCALGKCAAALVPLQRAIHLMDFKSLALKAWLFIEGREGCRRDEEWAFELANRGASLGCHHCEGVAATLHWTCCHCHGVDGAEQQCRALAMDLAIASANAGSRYGQFALGRMQETWERNEAEALSWYRLAAAQYLDAAQCVLGYFETAPDTQTALYRLAAAQGYPPALFSLAMKLQECNPSEAAFLQRRAQVAGTCNRLQLIFKRSVFTGFMP